MITSHRAVRWRRLHGSTKNRDDFRRACAAGPLRYATTIDTELGCQSDNGSNARVTSSLRRHLSCLWKLRGSMRHPGHSTFIISLRRRLRQHPADNANTIGSLTWRHRVTGLDELRRLLSVIAPSVGKTENSNSLHSSDGRTCRNSRLQASGYWADKLYIVSAESWTNQRAAVVHQAV